MGRAALDLLFRQPRVGRVTARDESLTYSRGYFENDDDSLATAQRNKIDYPLRKLGVEPGHRLLDIDGFAVITPGAVPP